MEAELDRSKVLEPVTPKELSYVMAEHFYGRSKPLLLTQMVMDLLPAEQRGQISDGYHTFNELYEHRIELFIALCRIQVARSYPDMHQVWRSVLHSDGSSFEGWFLLGIGKKSWEQITYHLPLSRWEDTSFAETLNIAPPFDGHTAQDVLERLKTL